MENIDLIEKVYAMGNRDDDCWDIKVSTFDDNEFTIAKCWDGGFADYLKKMASDYIETKKDCPKSKEETDDFNEKYDDHLDESSKVTLTFGQLKRLVKESRHGKYALMDAYLGKAKEICRDIGLSDDVEPSEQWDTDYIDYYVSTKDGTGGNLDFEKDGTWVAYIKGKKIASGKFNRTEIKNLVKEWHSFDDEDSEEGGKWEVCYKDKSGDITTVWVRARDAEEAEDKVRDEYWDVVRIVCVEKM